MATRLDIGGTDIGEWLMDDLNLKLQCEVQTGIYSNGGFTEKNKAVARFSLLYYKADNDPITFRNAMGPDFDGLMMESGFHALLPGYNERKAEYQQAFDAQLNFIGESSLSSGASFTTVSIINYGIYDIIILSKATVAKLKECLPTAEQWWMLGEITLTWSWENLSDLIPWGVGAGLSIVKGFNKISQGDYIWGGIDIGLGCLHFIPITGIGVSLAKLGIFIAIPLVATFKYVKPVYGFIKGLLVKGSKIVIKGGNKIFIKVGGKLRYLKYLAQARRAIKPRTMDHILKGSVHRAKSGKWVAGAFITNQQ